MNPSNTLAQRAHDFAGIMREAEKVNLSARQAVRDTSNAHDDAAAATQSIADEYGVLHGKLLWYEGELESLRDELTEAREQAICDASEIATLKAQIVLLTLTG